MSSYRSRMALRFLSLALLIAQVPEVWCGIPSSEFRERRARLLALADTDAVLVFRSANGQTRSGDVTYPFRQESNLLYLTGISEPGLTLLVIPRGADVDGKAARLMLFCPDDIATSIKEMKAFEDGRILGPARFRQIFDSIVGSTRQLMLSGANLPFVEDWLNDRPMFLEQEARQRLQGKYPDLKIRNAALLVARLREFKSPAEIDAIREAIRVTGDGIRHAMALCRPGAAEYELQAALEYEMVRQGATGTGFPSIVGSGPNSLILHYDRNRRVMEDGEVVVMDVGAEMDGYSADITRTLPVSGTFTEEQRRVYATVLHVQEEVIRMIRPGVRWSSIESRAREMIGAAGFPGRMTHGVSHHVGLDTHDVGEMDTLREGMVITVEPGIYIEASDTSFSAGYRGCGVRIEDDVLVGKDGAVVLSSNIPKDIETIETRTGRDR